jgi:hypothetical protein
MSSYMFPSIYNLYINNIILINIIVFNYVLGFLVIPKALFPVFKDIFIDK